MSKGTQKNDHTCHMLSHFGWYIPAQADDNTEQTKRYKTPIHISDTLKNGKRW